MKKIIILLFLISVLYSCALRPIDPMRARNNAVIDHERARDGVTIEDYIQNKIDEGLEQYAVRMNEEPPQPKYGFDGDIVLKVPRSLRVYGKPIERRYKTSSGSFSEILPGGWRLIIENGQKGWIVHSLGRKEYPTIGDIDILTGGQKR